MKKETVSLAPAGLASETVLPLRVQEALGQLVGAAKDGCSRSASVSAWECWPS